MVPPEPEPVPEPISKPSSVVGISDQDNKLEEQRLIESLEKQRQLQQQQQQQLLLEEQQKENERKAKLKAEEEERLRKMRETNNMHKQPLSQKTQNHDNYYENTMTAAGIYLISNSLLTNNHIYLCR